MFLLYILLTSILPLATSHPGCHEKRQTEESWSQIQDPQQECAWYDYPPVNAIAASYPGPYDTASILSNDSEAWSIFNSLNSSVNERLPNDPPRGTQSGDFSSFHYAAGDPDCWWTYNGCTTPSNSTGIPADIATVPEPNTWGLTLDDGPLCSHNAFYDFLAENQQKATLFYIGGNIMSYPLQALRGFDDGHQICVHTWPHKYMTSLSNEQVFAELYYTRRIIKGIMGVTPKCWRPPYGDVDNRVRMFAQGLNLTTIVWDRDTADWTLNSPSVTQDTRNTVNGNYESFINESTSGAFDTYGPIVLSHELSNSTLSEMMTFYPRIKAAFKHVVPIAAAMNQTNPYVETNWVYPTFEQYVSGQINQTNSTTTRSGGSTSVSSTAAASRTSSMSSSLSSDTSSASSSVATKNNSTFTSGAERLTSTHGLAAASILLLVVIML